MIRRLALVSSIAVLSAVAFTPQAEAAPQTQDVDFNGTVEGICTFTGTTAGTLVSNNTDGWIEASNGTNIGTRGTASQTTVKCTSGGQLSVSAPVKVSAPPSFVDTVKQAVVYDATADAYTSVGGPFNNFGWVKPTTPLTIPVNTDRTLSVGAIIGVNNQNGVPFGTYQYRVTLTATPN